jgi:hypothetical protein
MPNRILKESINSSETLAQCSIGANLLFDRLTTKADDHGCFDARVKIIRGGVFPLMMDKVRETDIEKWLNELAAVDSVRLWVESNGVRYGLFPAFGEHQRVRSIHKRKTPEPPESVTSLDSKANNKPLTTDSECQQPAAKDGLNPNPNPNPNPVTHMVCDWFEEDWASYPRKAGSKSKALSSYKKSVSTPAERKAFQDKTAAYLKSCDDPQYIKHGATWFNQWEDHHVDPGATNIVTDAQRKARADLKREKEALGLR